MQRQFKWSLAAMAVMTAACSDGDSFGPDQFEVAATVATPAPVCQTIDFNTPGGAADHMTAWGGTSVFSYAVTAAGYRYPNASGQHEGAQAPRLFFSPITDQVEDNDLQYPIDGPPANYGGSDAWNDGPACADCESLDVQSFLVLPDERTDGGNPFYGDYRWGGTITLNFAGLPANTYYVNSWHAVDDDGGEPSIDLYADGSTFVSQSTGSGDAEVELVTSAGVVYFNNSLEFQFGTEEADGTTGSGGIDNIEICYIPESEPGVGRMTGGGVKAIADAGSLVDQPGTTTVTLGLTLHCDNKLSNNLEVNWGRGQAAHQWHIEKETLENIVCVRNGNPPEPPAAPIDYFEADAMGRLDGVDGSKLHFVFEDFGEPGKNDRITMTIYEPNSNTVALQINLKKISVGNLQMHYDQPHGQKP